VEPFDKYKREIQISDIRGPGKIYPTRFRAFVRRAMAPGSPRRILIIPSSVFFFLIVPSATFVVGGRLDWLLGLPLIRQSLLVAVGALSLLVYGGYFVIESIRVLLDEGGGVPLGDLIPSDQSRALIVTGVYSKTRNPMLFGYFLFLCGLGLLEGSLSSAFLLPLIYMGVWLAWIKLKEEPALERRFGVEYRRYREEIPFLIPRLRG
jgi:protein-S-isoprenylcysteine O-methyltransferase Ste14